MSSYFIPYEEEEFISNYLTDLKTIRRGVCVYGCLLCTNSELANLWRNYSDDRWAANWIDVTPDTVSEFVSWLKYL